MSEMLINVRGSCGSGKSHLVRTFLSSTAKPLMCEGRRYPMAYQDENLIIVGHYENKAMGGADSFKTIDEAYRVAEMFMAKSCVLIEGKCQERDTEHVINMRHIGEVWAICLTTPLIDCINSVRNRVSANAIRDENIARSFRKAQRDAKYLASQGINVLWSSRSEAIVQIKRLIEIHANRSKRNATYLYS